jgi:CRP-like cAMP-binding protein
VPAGAAKIRILKAINLGQPEERILAVIDLLKSKLSRAQYGRDAHFVVPVTRQEIADMTGLRVETVIRKVGLLEEQGKLLRGRPEDFTGLQE